MATIPASKPLSSAKRSARMRMQPPGATKTSRTASCCPWSTSPSMMRSTTAPVLSQLMPTCRRMRGSSQFTNFGDTTPALERNDSSTSLWTASGSRATSSCRAGRRLLPPPCRGPRWSPRWIAGSIREEHRQAVEWLNEKTDTDTEFFAVVVEVLQIDDRNLRTTSRPVAFPNDWQRITRRQAVADVSPRGERYRQYFQPLIDELREKHRFPMLGWHSRKAGTHFRLEQRESYSVPSSASHDRARVEVYLGLPDRAENKALFDWLLTQRDSIEKSCGFTLEWERLEERRASRISVVRAGSIDDSTSALDEIRKWQIEKLLVIRKLFAPLLKAGVKEVGK